MGAYSKEFKEYEGNWKNEKKQDQIDVSLLEKVSGVCGYKGGCLLIKPAKENWIKMKADCEKATGLTVTCSSAYRDADYQIDGPLNNKGTQLWHAAQPRKQACPPCDVCKKPEYKNKVFYTYDRGKIGCPGGSPHGWGRAVDIQELYAAAGGSQAAPIPGKKGYENAMKMYNWLNQNSYKYGFLRYIAEAWHFEFQGNPLTKAGNKPDNPAIKGGQYIAGKNPTPEITQPKQGENKEQNGNSSGSPTIDRVGQQKVDLTEEIRTKLVQFSAMISNGAVADAVNSKKSIDEKVKSEKSTDFDVKQVSESKIKKDEMLIQFQKS